MARLSPQRREDSLSPISGSGQDIAHFERRENPPVQLDTPWQQRHHADESLGADRHPDAVGFAGSVSVFPAIVGVYLPASAGTEALVS